MTRRKTINEIYEQIKQEGDNEYELDIDKSKYINNKEKSLYIRHLKCNKFISSTDDNVCSFNQWTKGLRCHCINKSMTKKKTTEEFIKEIKDKNSNIEEILGEYINSRTKIRVRYKCGHENNVAPSVLLRGFKCAICTGALGFTTEDFKKQVYDLVGDEYTVLEEYVKNDKKIKMRHNSDFCNNHVYTVTPDRFKTGDRCPECRRLTVGKAISKSLKSRTDANWMNNKIELFTNGEYSLYKDHYYGSDKDMEIQHNSKKCNYSVIRMLPTNFFKYNGRKCPFCTPKMYAKSLAEMELLKFVKSCCPDDQIHSGFRQIVKETNKEIDVYDETKKIGFEYDGFKFHSDAFVEDTNSIDKKMLCYNNGIKLYRIFEDEWSLVSKRKITESKIKHILGCNNNPKIYARKCIIKEIEDSKIKNKFLENNHIQGTDRSLLSLGLFYENKLVAVMTFKEPNKLKGFKTIKEDCYELSRFATDIDYRVIGAFGKLWKYFINNYEFDEIYTYADLRWSDFDNNLYIKNNFEFVRQSKPNYWYLNKNFHTREYRGKYAKQNLPKLFPDIYSKEKTERIIMEEAGYHRIYDCGNLVFKFKNKDYNKQ